MRYRKKIENKTMNIFISDDILYKDQHNFIKIIEGFVDSEEEVMNIHLNEVRFIDSAGLGLFMLAKQAFEDVGKILVIKNPKDQVRSVFDNMNFNEMFNIEFGK